MPIGNNQYTILLQAKINEAGFQTYLNSLKNFSVKLNATMAGATTSVGGTTAATSGATQATQKLTYASREAQTALRAQADAFRAAGNITTEYTDKTGNLVRVVGQFTNVQGEAVTSTSVWSGKTGELDTRLKTVANQIKNTADRTKDFTANIANNILKVIQWAIATAAIYGTLKKIGEGVTYITELNKALIDAQIVTGMTGAEIYKLGLQYNALAQQLGATTLQVADASIEFLRQGKTVEETQKLVTESVMMSKLANMDAAASTEALTAIMNGFQLQVNDLSLVLDKLVKLDNAYASSVQEISSAMQRSSNSALLAGVTFDELASYIVIVSATTRKSSESIGESFKTMFARMQAVKASAPVDEFGESINNVEKVLRTFDIELRDSLNSFRPLGDVLDEIASKWENYSSVEKSQIAEAIAGVRQRENLLVLLNNYNSVLRAQTLETDAAGLAQQRYALYLDGVEAAANKMAAAWEGVWQKTISSETIKLLYNVSEGLAKIINKMGGLLPLAIALGVAIVFIKRQAIGAFFVSLYATLGPVGIAIAAVTAAIYLLAGSIKTSAEKLEKLNQEITTYQSNLTNLRSGREQLRALSEEYDALRTNTSRTADENERFLEIQQQIFGILPGVAQGFNDTGEAILNTNIPMQTYLDLQTKMIENEQTLLQIATAEGFGLRVKGYEQEIQSLSDLQNSYENWIKVRAQAASGELDPITAENLELAYVRAYGTIEELGLEIQKQNVTTEQGLIDLAQSYNSLTPALQQYLIDTGAVSESILADMKAITAAVVAQANVVLAAVNAINQALGKTNLFPGKVGGTMGTGFADAIKAASASVGGAGGKSMLDEIIDKIKEQKQAEKDALKDSLENYRRIIDARKDLLKSLKDEMDYRDLLSDKEKDISKLQNELTSLSLDNSEEAQARRLQLQEELGDKQEDLERTQRDRQYDLEVEMLDKEFEAFEYLIDAQIAAIDAYLKNTTQMMVDAMLQLGAMTGGASSSSSNNSASIYTSKPPQNLPRRLTNVINRPIPSHTITTAELTGRHSGIESGFVGGLKSNEEFAKLMDGELVLNQKQMSDFMKYTLPKIPAMVNTAGGQGMKFDNLLNINVAGNLDKSTIPDLERITDKVMANLNKTLAAKGYIRSVNQFVS